MSHHRNWRPPWEEVETRTGGYYGRQQGCSADNVSLGGGGNYSSRGAGGRPCREEGGGSQRRYCGRSTSERHLMQHHRDDPRVPLQLGGQQQQYRPQDCYGGGFGGSTSRWDHGYDPAEHPSFDNYGGRNLRARRGDDPNDRHYYPRPPATRVVPQDDPPYCYDGQGYCSNAYDGRGDNNVAYGVGLPVQDNGRSISRFGTPPHRISASSSGLTVSSPSDDGSSSSSNGSRGGGVGPSAGRRSLDPLDGGGGGGGGCGGGHYARPPPLRGGGFESMVDSSDNNNNDNEQRPAPMKRAAAIEIVPGVKVPLRGAKETWDAFRRNFYVSVMCVACASKVYCIKDADYVLCPVCRVISPLEIIISKKPSSRWRRIGGLGLGFTGEQDLRSQREKTKAEMP